MRVAYITGASRGLGLEIARTLSERYALGLGCLKTAPPALPMSIELRGDVADPLTAELAVQALMDQYGRLDLFVANAAVSRDRALPRMSDAEWDETLATNLSGVFYGLRACAPALAESKGHAILVGSLIGRRGAAGSVNYAAAKAGLIALALTAAKEWAPDVRVNVVIPGYMDTDMGRETPDAAVAAKSDHLLGTWTDVGDAAALVASVAELKSVTGQVFTADGRLSRWL